MYRIGPSRIYTRWNGSAPTHRIMIFDTLGFDALIT